VASAKTKTAVINEALRDYARRRDVRGFLNDKQLLWRGWVNLM